MSTLPKIVSKVKMVIILKDYNREEILMIQNSGGDYSYKCIGFWACIKCMMDDEFLIILCYYFDVGHLLNI